MKGLLGNRYVQAASVAFITGLIAAASMYLSTITDGLDLRHTVKDVGTAFLAPFMLLVSILPKITDIITPTVRIVSGLPITEAAPPEREIVTSGPLTTVAVAAPPPAAIGHRVVTPTPFTGTGGNVVLGASAPVKRSHHAAKVPVVAPVDAVSDH